MTMPGSIAIGDVNTNVTVSDACNCPSNCCFPRRTKKHVKGCPSDPLVCSSASKAFENIKESYQSSEIAEKK